jgi:hypothetical protein
MMRSTDHSRQVEHGQIADPGGARIDKGRYRTLYRSPPPGFRMHGKAQIPSGHADRVGIQQCDGFMVGKAAYGIGNVLPHPCQGKQGVAFPRDFPGMIR